MPSPKTRRTKIFISYSHKDKKWLKRLQVHLTPLVREGTIDLWDDTRLQAGENWLEEIQRAIRSARVAVLLISADFLASDFIAKYELPLLLAAARRQGAMILPLILAPCLFTDIESLSQFKAVNDPLKPLSGLRWTQQEVLFVDLTKTIVQTLKRLEKSLDHIMSYTRQLADTGVEPSTEVKRAELIQASEARGRRVEEGFQIPGDAEVVCIQRVRKGDNVPYAIQSVYLRPELCPGILDEDLTELFNLYKRKYKRRMVSANEIIQVTRASDEEAELLQIEPGAPVVIRDRVSRDQNDEVFEVLHSIDRADKVLYEINLRLSEA